MREYLKKIDGWLYIILAFCLIGIARNIWQLTRHGFDYGNIGTKVFVAMLLIYFCQIALILFRERKVWIISAIQAFFCFYAYEDFTFTPITNMLRGIILFFAPNMEFGWRQFMETSIVSLLFSLELLKTYLLYALTDPLYKTKPKAAAAVKE